MRTDLYGLVHKAQRYHLFAFARELSRADLTEPTTRVRIAHGAREIAELLADHAQNEARYIHPLYAALGSQAATLEAEHRELDALIGGWLAILDEGRWPELYRATMRLIGQYLLHIDGEERAQEALLWPSYNDAELGAVMARFKAERAPELAQADLAFLLPALSAPELARVVASLSAPSGGRRTDPPRFDPDPPAC